MATVTIKGGQGSDTISFAFTVTGTNTTAYANAFATNVNSILTTGTITSLAPDNGPKSMLLNQVEQSSQVYVLTPPTVGGALPDYTIATAGYVLDTISGAATINLDSVGGDTVLVAAINAEATVIGAGGDNQVIFVTGNNVFDGTADTGGDTVVGGSGFDTIMTSTAGSTTVNSGTGNATIILQDTTAGGLNDFVWLNDGSSTVFANGAGDAIIATTAGQTITDGSSGGYLGVEFTSAGGDTVAGNDLVNAGSAATAAVFDYSSNNTINGGTGTLYFIGGDGTAGVTATIDGGAGTAYLFASAGDSLTLGAGDSAGSAYFVAGLGNESLDGAASTGTLYAFGGTDTAGSDSITGGSGFNLLTAGAGSETLTGGAGTNYFQITESAPAGSNITISDFLGGNSTLILDGPNSQADAQAIYNATSANDVNGSLVVTISDSTTITFTGITTGSQLQGHIVTF